ncbi:MAG TPA: hypothetical protein VGS58_17280, partial [Candidatus Sulfopaludibacter sp.]|nr:hypothetical protein [Candidatus Sulfopaludibacter sp.]
MTASRHISDVPRGLVRLANAVILAGALLCGVTFLAAGFIGRTGLYRALPAGLGIVLLACLLLPAAARVSLALSCFAAVVAVYAAELYFTFGAKPRSIGEFQKPSGSFDIRSAFEVITDLRNQGLDARANLAGRLPMVAGKETLPSDSGAILPLGGFSRRLIVFCNESGQYVTYRSDEYGFNNPPGIWQRRPVSIAALGDSFAQGFCTAPDQTFISRIRSRYPETLTLGMVGNGPLLEFAALKEYLAAVKPQTVLWFYFEANDLQDLADESRNPLLVRYREQPDFTQHLMERQPEIDSVWTSYESGLLDAWRQSRAPRLLRPIADWFTDVAVEHKNRATAARFLRLREVRGRLESRFRPVGDEEAQIPLLRAILQQADATVRSWGGTLRFV